MPDMLEGKKLKGLVITLCALGVILVLAIAAVLLVGPGIENLFIAIGAQVTGLGGLHQGAQMMADRSPNYPVTPAMAAAPPPVEVPVIGIPGLH